MKKFIMAAASLTALATVPAHAGDIRIGFYTAPPVVYRPAPVAYYPAPVYYAPRPVYYPQRVAYYKHPHKFKHGYNVAYEDGPYRGWR